MRIDTKDVPIPEPRKLVAKVKESNVERALCGAALKRGYLTPKFVSPGRRSVPDRLLMKAIPPEHRAIVARYFRFVELKAPGEKPSLAQEREHARLRALGYRVDVIDNIPAAIAAVEEN